MDPSNNNINPSPEGETEVAVNEAPVEEASNPIAPHDLWGELPGVINIRSPKGILAEQARALSARTRQALWGRVTTSVLSDYDLVSHELSIVVPRIKNYTVAVVRVDHPAEMYPARIYDLLADKYASKECRDEEEFEQALKAILQSERIRKVISALLTQSKDSVA